MGAVVANELVAGQTARLRMLSGGKRVTVAAQASGIVSPVWLGSGRPTA
jgi:hypothetical protein